MSVNEPRVFLLRHGETAWSKSGQHTSHTDIELTESGERQAEAARPLLGENKFDLVLSSPMQRARRTAELTGLTPYEVTDDVREWDYGELEGITTPEIRERIPSWTIWDGPWPGGETADQVLGRARRVVRQILDSGVERAAVVSHGHFLRVLAAAWVRRDVDFSRCLELSTAAVSQLGWEHDQPVLEHWNQVHHLP